MTVQFKVQAPDLAGIYLRIPSEKYASHKKIQDFAIYIKKYSVGTPQV